MSAILKFDFQKRKQLRFSEVNDLNYTKKDPILHVTTTFSLKQGETRTNSVPIPHPLTTTFQILIQEHPNKAFRLSQTANYRRAQINNQNAIDT